MPTTSRFALGAHLATVVALVGHGAIDVGGTAMILLAPREAAPTGAMFLSFLLLFVVAPFGLAWFIGRRALAASRGELAWGSILVADLVVLGLTVTISLLSTAGPDADPVSALAALFLAVAQAGCVVGIATIFLARLGAPAENPAPAMTDGASSAGRTRGAVAGGGIGAVLLALASASPDGLLPLAAIALILGVPLGWRFGPRAIRPGLGSGIATAATVTLFAVPLGALATGALLAFMGASEGVGLTLPDAVARALFIAYAGVVILGIPLGLATFVVAVVWVALVRRMGRRLGATPVASGVEFDG